MCLETPHSTARCFWTASVLGRESGRGPALPRKANNTTHSRKQQSNATLPAINNTSEPSGLHLLRSVTPWNQKMNSRTLYDKTTLPTNPTIARHELLGKPPTTATEARSNPLHGVRDHKELGDRKVNCGRITSHGNHGKSGGGKGWFGEGRARERQ